MICPGTTIDCDNPGCRRGGCQGRLPELPLFQAAVSADQQPLPPKTPELRPATRAEIAERLAA